MLPPPLKSPTFWSWMGPTQPYHEQTQGHLKPQTHVHLLNFSLVVLLHLCHSGIAASDSGEDSLAILRAASLDPQWTHL